MQINNPHVLLQGLMQIFDEMLEGVEHKLCLRHLYTNYKKRFGGGVLIGNLMMAATKSTSYQHGKQRCKS